MDTQNLKQKSAIVNLIKLSHAKSIFLMVIVLMDTVANIYIRMFRIVLNTIILLKQPLKINKFRWIIFYQIFIKIC